MHYTIEHLANYQVVCSFDIPSIFGILLGKFIFRHFSINQKFESWCADSHVWYSYQLSARINYQRYRLPVEI
jgi:hypothetical protein